MSNQLSEFYGRSRTVYQQSEYLSQQLEPELKVQMELDAHEKECAIRYDGAEN